MELPIMCSIKASNSKPQLHEAEVGARLGTAVGEHEDRRLLVWERWSRGGSLQD